MNDISVILTVWKRRHLERQLKSIYNQTADISNIYVYQNESHVDISSLHEKYKFNHIHSKDVNFKFHGRFTLPLLFNTKYTAIFDDDTIPNKKWLEYCVSVCEEKNGIIGANGRNYSKNPLCRGPGDNTHEHTKCDIVGHCWFFKTDWIHYMWKENPPTYDNGEDIHFCAACKMHGNIDAYYPAQPNDNREIWGDTAGELHVDAVATCMTANHNSIRNDLYKYWIDKGWKVN